MEMDLKRIYEKYGSHLLRTCFLYLKDKSLAEDALQDTMLKVYKNYGGFKELSSEKTWITRIAINVCKDYLKSSWYRKTDYIETLAEIEVFDETPENEDDRVLAVIMKLPVKYKEVLLLFYYDEFSIKEMSDMLEVSASVVTTRLNRARNKLKSVLEGGSKNGE